MKTGILIHGCNLQTENWRNIAWGEAPGKMGRIPQGLLAALTLNAEVVVLGTGASRKKFGYPGSPHTGKVLLEAEYAMAFLENRFDELQSFKAWSDHYPVQDEAGWNHVKETLRSRIDLDIESNNTVSEIKAAGEVFLRHGCTRVVLISSPTHLIRALRDASTIYQNDRRFEAFHDNILAMPSSTCYEGYKASDVVVIEPVHRPDRQTIPTHRRIARMLTLQRLESKALVEFMHDFDELLQQYEDRLHHPKSASVAQRSPSPNLAEVRQLTR